MATRKSKANNNGTSNGANLGFEAKLWAAADALRNNMDAAEYKHVVLGLIFASPFDDRVDSNEHETCTLATLRDTLLPKLISGELRIRNTRHSVELAN